MFFTHKFFNTIALILSVEPSVSARSINDSAASCAEVPVFFSTSSFAPFLAFLLFCAGFLFSAEFSSTKTICVRYSITYVDKK